MTKAWEVMGRVRVGVQYETKKKNELIWLASMVLCIFLYKEKCYDQIQLFKRPRDKDFIDEMQGGVGWCKKAYDPFLVID